MLSSLPQRYTIWGSYWRHLNLPEHASDKESQALKKKVCDSLAIPEGMRGELPPNLRDRDTQIEFGRNSEAFTTEVIWQHNLSHYLILLLTF